MAGQGGGVDRGYWSTLSECRFIRDLGIHRAKSGFLPSGRIQLLRGYVEGLSKRKDWGMLNKQKVTKFAKHELCLAEGTTKVPNYLPKAPNHRG